MPNTNIYHFYAHFGEQKKREPVAELTYGEKSAKSLSKGVKGLVSYGAIKGTAVSFINNEIKRVSIRTGAIEYEQKLQFGFDMANKITDSAVMVGIGLATGNLPLALIGVATSAITTLTGYWQNQRTIDLQSSVEQVSIGMQAVRSGTGGRRGSEQ